MIAGAYAVLWVQKDGLGNDACRFAEAEGGFLIDGSATDANWNVLRYRIRARDDGTTRRVRIGSGSRIFIRRTPDNRWTLNGTEVAQVEGAKDIELGFTPATMTLPIRRLNLDIGEEAELRVARLDRDGDALTPMRRIYRRTAHDRYECVNAETGETMNVRVTAQGIVRDHDGGWSAQK